MTLTLIVSPAPSRVQVLRTPKADVSPISARVMPTKMASLMMGEPEMQDGSSKKKAWPAFIAVVVLLTDVAGKRAARP
jgi:hypothetical protein